MLGSLNWYLSLEPTSLVQMCAVMFMLSSEVTSRDDQPATSMSSYRKHNDCDLVLIVFLHRISKNDWVIVRHCYFHRLVYLAAAINPCPCIHSEMMPLTSSGFCQSSQCEASTFLAVNSGTFSPIFLASSSVTIVSPRALTNRVGHLILVPFSISNKGRSASKLAWRLR
jgi:hypothetical protein